MIESVEQNGLVASKGLVRSRRQVLKVAGVILLGLASLESHRVIKAEAAAGVEVFNPLTGKPFTGLVHLANSDAALGSGIPADVAERMEGKSIAARLQVGEQSLGIYVGGLREPKPAIPRLRLYGGVGVNGQSKHPK